MTKRINMTASGTAKGGIGVGDMSAAGNPWTLPEGLADELVNRRIATYADVAASNPVPVVVDPVTGAVYANGQVIGSVSGAANSGIAGLVAGSPAAATANTGLINTTLAKKGFISISTQGRYYVNGSLAIYEDSQILITAGVELYRADGSNAPMLVSAYQAAPRISVTSVQATAVAGVAHAYQATVVFAAAHNMLPGQYVQLWGDTRRIYVGVWKIRSTPSSNTLTFFFSRGNIGTPPLDYSTSLPSGAGTITGNLAAGNVTVEMNGDLTGNGGNQGNDFGQYLVYLNKIGHSRVKFGRGADAYFHILTTANDFNLEVHSSHMDAYGVAAQCYGPSQGLKLTNNYVENCGDDGFAFLTKDNVGFPTVPPTTHNIGGDIFDPSVTDCRFNRVDGSGCVTSFNLPSNGYQFDGMKVLNLECLGSSPALLACNGNFGSYEARGLRYRGMQMSGTTKVGGVEKVFFLAGSQGYAMNCRSLLFSDIEQLDALGPAQGFAGQSTRLFDFSNQTAGTLVEKLTIDNASLFFDTTAYNSSTGYYGLYGDSAVTVNQLITTNIRGKSNGGSSVSATLFGPGGMTVISWKMDGVQVAGAGLGGLLANFSNTPKIVARNVAVLGGRNFVEGANVTMDLTVEHPVQTTATQGFFNLYGNGLSGTIDLTIVGARQLAGTVFANMPTNNAALKYSNPDASLPIDGTRATYRPGAMFYNTNAVYGAGVGLYAMGAAATTRLAA